MTPEEMAALHGAAFHWPRPWSAAEFADLLAQPGVFARGDARAFALVRVILDEAELLTIATRPEWRNRGLAREVMGVWQDEAARRGAVRAFLETAAGNAAAIALYTACGYARSGLRRGYYRRPDGSRGDAIVMSRALTLRQPG